MGEVALAQRPDRFLIKQPLLDQIVHARQWVGAGGASDHSPVYLEFLAGEQKLHSPFKFNATWLLDLEFHLWVTQEWQHRHLFPNR